MSLFSKLSNLVPKKLKTNGIFNPSYLIKTRSGSEISDDRVNQVNTDLTSLRYGQTTEEIARDFSENSPDMCHAVESVMRFCITDSFTLVAKDLETGKIDVAATQNAQAFAARINRLPTTFEYFSPQSTLNSISESLIPQVLTNGSCMAELVLDKSLLPSRIQAISTNNLKYEARGDRFVPLITESGTTTYLDSPAIYIMSLSQKPDTPYSRSWFKSAMQSIVSSTEFDNDLRRSFRKASLPRVVATIDTQKVIEAMTAETRYEPKKLKTAMDGIISDIENKLNGLQPEDTLVNYDTVSIEHLSAGNNSDHDGVATRSKMINGQVSTGLHVLPSILGRGESQTTASTEAVLFLKVIESLQDRLNEIFSYLFTLAVRMHGHDVTVTFKYKKPSLRPEIEEESFLSMRQSRIREQLSDGFISDEEASISLTGDIPSGNFTSLSGTGFHGKTESVENPYSNTSVGEGQVNNTKDQKDRKQGDSEPKTNKTTG